MSRARGVGVCQRLYTSARSHYPSNVEVASLFSSVFVSVACTASEEEEELEAVPRPHTERGVAVRRKRRVG